MEAPSVSKGSLLKMSVLRSAAKQAAEALYGKNQEQCIRCKITLFFSLKVWVRFSETLVDVELYDSRYTSTKSYDN